MTNSVSPMDELAVMETSASPCFCSHDVNQKTGPAVSAMPTPAASNLYLLKLISLRLNIDRWLRMRRKGEINQAIFAVTNRPRRRCVVNSA
ncbi:MAG: hypothetical protein ACREDY_12570 [Bradyrhizobium sp.]